MAIDENDENGSAESEKERRGKKYYAFGYMGGVVLAGSAVILSGWFSKDLRTNLLLVIAFVIVAVLLSWATVSIAKKRARRQFYARQAAMYPRDIEQEIRDAQTFLKKLQSRLSNFAGTAEERQALQDKIFDVEAHIEALESENYKQLHDELDLPGSPRIASVPNEKLSGVRDRVRTAEEIKKSVPPKPPAPKPQTKPLDRGQKRVNLKAEMKQIKQEYEEDLKDIPADPPELREQHRQDYEEKIRKKMDELSKL